MHFLYPAFLYALALISIPVIIHLFNFRRYKKIVFSDIRFLKQLTEQNKKQQSIKQWLILLCRMLAIAFLVFAFAQPFIPGKNPEADQQSNWISIYIDNSFSMQANSKEGSLFELARKKAKQLAASYKESDRFQLLTNDFEGKHQRLVNRKEFLQMLDELKVSSVHRNLNEIYQRQKSVQNQMGNQAGTFYWLSDFQKNMAAANWQTDSVARIYLVPVQGEQQQNVWIDSAWFAEPLLKMGTKNLLMFRVRNESENNFENQPVVLKTDGVQKAIQNITCPAGEQKVFSMHFTLPDYNWHGLSISITDYPLVFDDTYFLSARARQYAAVLLIQDESPGQAIEKVYVLDPFYQLKSTSIRQINFADFPAASAILLNEPLSISSGLSAELIKYMQGGGVVLFIPSPKPADQLGIQNFLLACGMRIESYNKQSMQVTALETREKIFDQVFSRVPESARLPVVSGYWPLSGSKAGFHQVARLNNDFPFLARSKVSKGSLFALASSIQSNESDFTRNALFVPFILNLPLQNNFKYPSSFVLGEQSMFRFEAKAIQQALSLKTTKQEHVIDAKIVDGEGMARLSGQIREANVYSLTDGNEEWSKIAFNYPRSESAQGYQNLEELAKQVQAKNLDPDLSLLKAKLDMDLKGTHFWQWMLVLALVFLFAEMALIRWVK